MIKNSNIQNPLLRDGSSQQQRLLKALLPAYVSVDERSMEDLVAFASNYARLIAFYDSDNTPKGNWSGFFDGQVADKVNQTTQPHYALFLAFLEMFKFAQQDLNTITQRHLDFYYKEVLKLKEQEAVPDQVYVIFQLAQNAASHLVEAGSELNAGNDATGARLVYKTDRAIAVNKAGVGDLKALHYDKGVANGLYASPFAKSADGVGAELEGDEKRWRTFGKALPVNQANGSAVADRPMAGVGFAFSSPALLLSEGLRQVYIMMDFESTAGITAADVTNAFTVYFSGDKDWFKPSDLEGGIYLQGNRITIKKRITVDQPAVVPYNKQKLKDSFDTSWPVVKVILNQSAAPGLYTKLKNLTLKKAELYVHTMGLRSVTLQNDLSGIDPTQPFQPFGNRPVIGSNFYLGSNEVFSKNLSRLSVNIRWQGLPEGKGGFNEHYNYYVPLNTDGSNKRKNESFKVDIALLDGKKWTKLGSAQNLFASKYLPFYDQGDISGGSEELFFGNTSGVSVSVPDHTLLNSNAITLMGDTLNSNSRKPELGLTKNSGYDFDSTHGFVRFTLSGTDFGHTDYQGSYAARAIKAATPRFINGQIESSSDAYPLPKEPYTPEIAEITLEYEASAELLLEKRTGQAVEPSTKAPDSFFHIEPFGVAERNPYTISSTSIKLLPEFNDEGSLYIGIRNLTPPQTLSLLFRLSEGTSNPDLPKQKLKWSYLSNNEWVEFPSRNVLSDATGDFLKTGIVVLDIPKSATSTNTILPYGQHWIKVSASENSSAVCDLIDIHAQAALAVFSDNNNDPRHLLESIAAGSVKGFVSGRGAIQQVEQPYAAFGGKIKEQSNEFYTRISERLRHKNRAVCLWDYEHLVLAKFPEVYRAKCLNHCMLVAGNQPRLMVPGSVTVVLVSNVRNKNAVNPLKPKASLLAQNAVKEYLTSIAPPAVNLYVSNPVYEEIQLRFNVKFHNGFDNGFYQNLLESEIKMFLAPWAYNTADVSFGGTIHSSVVLNFIEEREYVNYVTVFKMDQLTSDQNFFDVQEAKATTPASILTSSASHQITVLETDATVPERENTVGALLNSTDDCGDCQPGTQSAAPAYGIGAFTIGGNFVVGFSLPFGPGGLDTMEIEENFSID